MGLSEGTRRAQAARKAGHRGEDKTATSTGSYERRRRRPLGWGAQGEGVLWCRNWGMAAPGDAPSHRQASGTCVRDSLTALFAAAWNGSEEMKHSVPSKDPEVPEDDVQRDAVAARSAVLSGVGGGDANKGLELGRPLPEATRSSPCPLMPACTIPPDAPHPCHAHVSTLQSTSPGT